MNERREIRHRPSEPISPRPSDLIADRLRVLAAWATKSGTSIEIDGKRFDGAALEALAQSQLMAETELLAHFRVFRGYYVNYTDVLQKRERLLREAIQHLELHRDNAATRTVLRLCKLRRPPLAKVRALVAEARAAGDAMPPRETGT
jgi:hypothetical protein